MNTTRELRCAAFLWYVTIRCGTLCCVAAAKHNYAQRGTTWQQRRYNVAAASITRLWFYCGTTTRRQRGSHVATTWLARGNNVATTLIDGAMKYSHATPLLKKLHWLPIVVRVEFNILLLTHRALNGHAPDYIAQCISRRQPVRSLRSSEHSLLCVPRTRRYWGDRAFSVAAPSQWKLECTTAASDIFIYDHCCI